MNEVMLAIRAGLVYVLPVLVGRGLVVGSLLLRGHQYLNKSLITETQKQTKTQKKASKVGVALWLVRIGFYFALGMLVLFGLALLVRYGLGVNSFGIVFFPAVWLVVVMAALVNGWRRPRDLVGKLKQVALPLATILIMASGVSWLWRYKSPYPLNWDWYQHQTLSNYIQDGVFSFRTTEISSTFGFDSYPPSVALLLALAQYGGNFGPVEMIGFWKYLSFYHLVSVGVVSWMLGLSLGKRAEVGLLSAMIGVGIFDSAVSFTNLFFLPQTLAAVVFVWMLVGLLGAFEKGKSLSGWQTMVAVLALSGLHYVVGTVAALSLLGVDIYGRMKKRLPGLAKGWPWVSVVIVLAVVGVIASGYVDLSYLNEGEAKHYIFTMEKKGEFLEQSYGYLAYVLVPLGLVWMVRNWSKKMGVVLLVLFGLLMIVASGFPYVVKFYTLARFLVGGVMALGMWKVLSYVKSRALKWFAVLAVSVGLGVMLVVNVAAWKTGLLYEGEFTHLSVEDIGAAEFLKKEYGESNALIISDPSTQFVLSGLSGVNSAGGAYMTKNSRGLLVEALESGELGSMKMINDPVHPIFANRLLVVSGRTYSWLAMDEEERSAFAFNVWSPVKLSLSDWKRVGELEKVKGLEKVYSSDYLVILGVK